MTLQALPQTTKPRSEAEEVSKKLAKVIPPEGWEVEPPKDLKKPGALIKIKGKNCVIATTAGRDAAQDLGRFIDNYLELFRKIFTAKFMIDLPLSTVVFAHKAEFDSYYESTYKTSETFPRKALYCPHKKETWIVLQGDGKKKTLPLETAKHELTHHMLHL